jgi:hypothetical protein
MDRDTIRNLDIDFSLDLQFERHDTEVVTERLSALELDPEDAEPTLKNVVSGTLPRQSSRLSDPLIPPPVGR